MERMSAVQKISNPAHQTIFVDFKTREILDVQDIGTQEKTVLPVKVALEKRVLLSAIGVILLVLSAFGLIHFTGTDPAPIAKKAIQFSSGEYASCQVSEVTACGVNYSRCSDGKNRFCATNVTELSQ